MESAIGRCGARLKEDIAAKAHAVPARGTVLAFDWGQKRIGVAVGELELRTAHPVGVIDGTRREAADAALDALVAQWRPVLAVVGLPVRIDDDGVPAAPGDRAKEHPMAPRCRDFARRLEHRYSLPVHLVDERFTSWAAEDLLRRDTPRWQDRKARLDQVAAQQILETFFELATATARS